MTLIELLVAVAVIALLVSVLMPALAGARRQGRTIQCASHQRQLALGMATYLHDFDGTYPQPFQDGYFDTAPQYPPLEKARMVWYNALDPYLDQPRRTYANAHERNNVPIKHDPAWHRLSDNERLHNKTLKMNEHFGDSANSRVKWVRAHQVRRASSTVLLGDGRANDLSNEHASLSIPGRFHLRPAYIGLRHAGGANIAFVDGRAERIEQPTLTIDINDGAGGVEPTDAWHPADDPQQRLTWHVGP